MAISDVTGETKRNDICTFYNDVKAFLTVYLMAGYPDPLYKVLTHTRESFLRATLAYDWLYL